MSIIFVFGGTMSSVGKGICAASIGALSKATISSSVSAVKIDPYLNCDAGLMSPYEHGEVYVLDDGTEADLDLGNYERFLGTSLSSKNSITTGQIYKRVIESERTGKYLGKTVQVIPHITDEIERRITAVSDSHDITIVEVGGTIGDIEMMPFVHAIARMSQRDNNKARKYFFALVAYIPMVSGSCGNEQKTKPTQHTVAQLRSYGISPDWVMCRCIDPVVSTTLSKISTSCGVPREQVISCHNVKSVEDVPGILASQGMQTSISKLTGHPLSGIEYAISRPYIGNKQITIALVGKYISDCSMDAYLTVIKALEHAAVANHVNISIVVTPKLEQHHLETIDGVVIPGGFGDRGIDDKIDAVVTARSANVPVLGLCLGMQAIVLAAARTLWPDANSEEFCTQFFSSATTEHPIISRIYDKGMRCGAHEVKITDELLVKHYKGRRLVQERFRHKYAVSRTNSDFQKIKSVAGLQVAGQSEHYIEAVSWPSDGGTYCYGFQYHPEFATRSPDSPSPVFAGFVENIIA